MENQVAVVDKEIWKPVDGYENIYSVSNFGNIKRVVISKGTKGLIVLKPIRDGIKRYKEVRLYKDSQYKNFAVHRIVAQAFIGNPNGLHVNHKDGNKGNNGLNNLEYVTPRQNCEHAAMIGLVSKGEGRWNTKFSNKDILSIRKEYENGNTTQRKLAKKYSVSQYSIACIVNKSSWKHVKEEK